MAKIYHVRYRDDGWVVEAEDAQQPSAVEARKKDAVQRAREIADNQQPSRLIVHKQDGTVQSESTYGDLEEVEAAEEPHERARERERAREGGPGADAGYALAALANDALQLATEAVSLARALPSKAQELRDLASRREQLNERIRELREVAEQRFDEKAAQGRTVAEEVLSDERVQRVIDQAKTAQSQVKAAMTSIRKTGDEAAAGAAEAGRDQAENARRQTKAAATSLRKTAETAVDAGKDATQG